MVSTRKKNYYVVKIVSVSLEMLARKTGIPFRRMNEATNNKEHKPTAYRVQCKHTHQVDFINLPSPSIKSHSR